MSHKALGLFYVLALLLSAQVAHASTGVASNHLFELQEVPHLSSVQGEQLAAKCGSGACGGVTKETHKCGSKSKEKSKNGHKCGSKQKKQQCGSKNKAQQCGTPSKAKDSAE